MRRDDDYIRDLLFEAETSESAYLYAGLVLNTSDEDLKRHMHCKWLTDAGFFHEHRESVFRITNQGHDYLSAIRSETVWIKTKAAASSAGGLGLGLMKDIAMAYVKQELSGRLGIQL